MLYNAKNILSIALLKKIFHENINFFLYFSKLFLSMSLKLKEKTSCLRGKYEVLII